MFLENDGAFKQEGSLRNISTNCFLLFFILFFHCFPALISLRVSIQGEKFLVVTEFDPASQCMSHILQIKPQAKFLTLNFGVQSQRPKNKNFNLSTSLSTDPSSVIPVQLPNQLSLASIPLTTTKISSVPPQLQLQGKPNHQPFCHLKQSCSVSENTFDLLVTRGTLWFNKV